MQPTIRRRWSKIGKRPVAETNRKYEWLWSFAAVEPVTGKSFWLTLPSLSGETAQIFLDEFAAVHAPEGKRVVLMWDGAPAHRTKKLQVPERNHAGTDSSLHTGVESVRAVVDNAQRSNGKSSV
ncbi:MAG: transposase [Acidobacteriota bacterium]|nr:transposase [Acidobacteriota bacterium]